MALTWNRSKKSESGETPFSLSIFILSYLFGFVGHAFPLEVFFNNGKRMKGLGGLKELVISSNVRTIAWNKSVLC